MFRGRILGCRTRSAISVAYGGIKVAGNGSVVRYAHPRSHLKRAMAQRTHYYISP